MSQGPLGSSWCWRSQLPSSLLRLLFLFNHHRCLCCSPVWPFPATGRVSWHQSLPRFVVHAMAALVFPWQFFLGFCCLRFSFYFMGLLIRMWYKANTVNVTFEYFLCLCSCYSFFPQSKVVPLVGGIWPLWVNGLFLCVSALPWEMVTCPGCPRLAPKGSWDRKQTTVHSCSWVIQPETVYFSSVFHFHSEWMQLILLDEIMMMKKKSYLVENVCGLFNSNANSGYKNSPHPWSNERLTMEKKSPRQGISDFLLYFWGEKSGEKQSKICSCPF